MAAQAPRAPCQRDGASRGHCCWRTGRVCTQHLQDEIYELEEEIALSTKSTVEQALALAIHPKSRAGFSKAWQSVAPIVGDALWVDVFQLSREFIAAAQKSDANLRKIELALPLRDKRTVLMRARTACIIAKRPISLDAIGSAIVLPLSRTRLRLSCLSGRARSATHHGQENLLHTKAEYICTDLSIASSLFPCSRVAGHTFAGS